MKWWAEEAEWLATRMDRWLASCQGYSKLRTTSSDQERKRNPIKTCAQRIQSNIARVTSARRPAAQPSRQQQQQPSARTPVSKSRSSPSVTVSTEIVFEKCKPRPRHTPVSESARDLGGIPALDIVYYPFREENCVVCKQIPCPCPCPREDCAPCHFVPTAQQQASGATGALFFRPAPPAISMSQDFIEVRYDHCGDAPPSYDSAVRREAQLQPKAWPPPRCVAVEDDDPGERTIFSRSLFEERTIFSRPPARYRSRGRFSSVMYETQRAFEEAFQQSEEPTQDSVPRAPRSRSLHGPPQRMGLREVDLPHNSTLHSLLSFRRRPRQTPRGGGVAPKQSAGRTTCSGRPEKRVVVGDRGIHGPVWPRVILTFDRGVSPCQATPRAPPACPPQSLRQAQLAS